MIRCNQFGQHTRLGNWLFVYAFICSAAEKTGHEVEMPEGYFLWKYLEEPPRLTNETGYDVLFKPKGPQYTDEWFAEAYDFFSENRDKIINVDLTCFLQSERWFDPEIVKRRIKIKQEHLDSVCRKYQTDLTGVKIGIGIRRGDFVGHGVFYQIPEEWYVAAYAGVRNRLWESRELDNHRVYVMSDDIEWCKSRYSGLGFVFAQPNGTHVHGFPYHADPMEHFILGALCDIFIGGSSTFSWWQMWYVRNINGGEAIHCGKNISDAFYSQYGHPDYYPKNWKKFW